MGLFGGGNPFKDLGDRISSGVKQLGTNISSGVEQLGRNTTSGINQLEKNTSAGFDSAINLGINKPIQLLASPFNALGSQLTPEGASILSQGAGVAAGLFTGGGSNLLSGLGSLFGGNQTRQESPSSSSGPVFIPMQSPAPIAPGTPAWVIPAAIAAGVVGLVLILKK